MLPSMLCSTVWLLLDSHPEGMNSTWRKARMAGTHKFE